MGCGMEGNCVKDFFGEAMLNPYLIKVRIGAALPSPLKSGKGSLPFNINQ